MLKALLTAAVSAVGILGIARADEPLPTHVAFGYEQTDAVALSPDGQRVAVASSHGGTNTLKVLDLETGTLLTNRVYPDAVPQDLVWADDDHLVLTARQLKDVPRKTYQRLAEWMAFVVDVPDGRSDLLFGRRASLRSADIALSYGILPDPANPGTILVPMSPVKGDIDLYRVDLDTLKRKVVARGEGVTYAFVHGPDGVPQVRLDASAYGIWTRVYWRNDKGRWQRFDDIMPSEDDGTRARNLPVAAGPRPGAYHVVARAEGGAFAGLREGGPNADPNAVHLSAPVGFDLLTTTHDPRTDAVIGGTYLDAGRRFVAMDAGLQADVEAARASISEDASVAVVDRDRTGRRLVLRLSGPTSPDAFYLLDRDSFALAKLADRWSGVTASMTGPVERVSFEAADGLSYEATLTHPPAAPGTPAPLLVLPTGFEAVPVAGFDPEAQYYASRGLRVMRVALRGGYGRGAAFERAGDGAMTTAMADDLERAITWAHAQGYASPQTTCLFGDGITGTLVLLFAAERGETASCRVAKEPVTDMALWLKGIAWWEGKRSEDYARQRTVFLGSDEAVPVHALSPIRRTDEVSGRTLVLTRWGDDGQDGRELVGALRRARSAAVHADFNAKSSDDTTLMEVRAHVANLVLAFARQEPLPSLER